MTDDPTRALSFNGIDATSGGYLFPSMSPKQLADLAAGRVLEEEEGGEDHVAELQARVRDSEGKPHLGVKEGIDPADLSQAGWGVIFPAVKKDSEDATRQEAIREALAPLLEHRKAQASARYEHFYQEYRGRRGYRPGTSKQAYLADLGGAAGPVDPHEVPYYLLLVGSPEQLPFHLQYQIDVQYAVGRVHFDTVEEYAHYARSVVEVETRPHALPRHLAMVGVSNPDDPATQLSRAHLVEPLAERARSWDDVPGWTVQTLVDEAARKDAVRRLLGGDQTPGLLFTGSHGMGFPLGHELQRAHQGALLLQDWDGPQSGAGPISPDLYLSADDITDDASLLGLIAFNFACFGGGTPRYDEFAKQAFKKRKAIAEHPFVSRLHQRLLGHPRGGALAAIGHVERAWGCSFMWSAGRRKGKRSALAVFESTLRTLMKGKPVGMAVEYLNQRYAELASDLAGVLEQLEWTPNAVDDYTMADMWTSSNDARGYAILGDPAVRLPLMDAPESGSARASIEVRGSSVTMDAGAAPDGTRPTPTQAPVASDSIPSFSPQIHADTASLSGSPSGSPSGSEEALAQLRARLGETIEVRTYLSEDVAATASSAPQDAQLWAVTRISPSGDLDVIMPRSMDEQDAARWQRHVSMVEQAQRGRAQLWQALSSTAASPGPPPDEPVDPES